MKIILMSLLILSFNLYAGGEEGTGAPADKHKVLICKHIKTGSSGSSGKQTVCVVILKTKEDGSEGK